MDYVSLSKLGMLRVLIEEIESAEKQVYVKSLQRRCPVAPSTSATLDNWLETLIGEMARLKAGQDT